MTSIVSLTNLQWLSIFFGIPFLIFVMMDYKIFFEYRGIFIRIWLGSIFFALPWDILAVSHKAWTFPQGLSGIYLLNLPIEEYIWGLVFSAIITYFTLYQLKHGNK